MRIIAKCLGGSHAYGLNTPNSDKDIRGIFVNTEVAQVVGLERYEHQQNQNEDEDSAYYELRSALKLLKNGNTQVIELLFNQNWIELWPDWSHVITHRDRLISSDKLFSCLRGYMQGELRLTLGEGRTGRLGSKRYEQLQRFGFSPKNATNMLRLPFCGSTYFKKGYFPVNIREENEEVWNLLMDIKTKPQQYSPEQIRELSRRYEAELELSYLNRASDTKFDIDLADWLCLRVYKVVLCDLFTQLDKRGDI